MNGLTARSKSPRPSTTAPSSPSATACSASASLAPRRTGSATAASIRRSATRARSATAAASRSPRPRCAASAWATSSWRLRAAISGISRAFPPAWVCCWISAPASLKRCSISPTTSSPIPVTARWRKIRSFLKKNTATCAKSMRTTSKPVWAQRPSRSFSARSTLRSSPSSSAAS